MTDQLPPRVSDRAANLRSTLGRRGLLQLGLGGGALLATGRFLTACGGSDDDDGASATTASGSGAPTATGGSADTATPEPGGVLRLAAPGGGENDTLHAMKAVNSADFIRQPLLYDALVRRSPSWELENRLLASAEPNADATEWVLTLKPDLMFHDGSPVTADAVIFSMQQVVDPEMATQYAPYLAAVDIAAVEKVDDLTVRVPLTEPNSILYELLVFPIIPTDFDEANPVGTGPFAFESFTPGVSSVFVRNDQYWGEPPNVDRIEVINFADEASTVNALLGGQVDHVPDLSVASIAQLESGGMQVKVIDGGGWNPFVMRVDVAPFDDVRVRQAFRLIPDRQEMLDLVFGGNGLIGNDVFGIFDAAYDTSLPQRDQDIEQAKALLAEAGHGEGLEVELVTGEIAAGVVRAAQVFAEHAKAAGVTVNIRQVTSGEFFGDNWLSYPFAQDWWGSSAYLQQVQQATHRDAVWNETHFDDDEYMTLYEEAISTADEAARTEIIHQMMAIDHERGGYIIPFFVPLIEAFAPNVRGIVESRSGTLEAPALWID